MLRKKYILITDDNAVNRKVLEKILSVEYNILQAENGEEALLILESRANDICAILLDLIMPVMDGFAFLERVHGDERYRNIPIVVTTGSNDNENEIKALKMGAWDFVGKPYNVTILRFRLRNAIDRSQLSAFHQLKYLAEYDTLTGIYNKFKFFKETKNLLDLYRGTPYVFVRFDIDRFQLINSFFGLTEGDKLLRFMATQVSQVHDNAAEFTYGRMESDIFCFCMPYDAVQFIPLLEKLRLQLTEYNTNYDIVPSFGIYVLEDSQLSVETMYNRATLAMKKSKGQYVNYYTFYDTQMSLKLTQEQEITNDMNIALVEGQFQIYLQPKYNIKTNMPSGAEALVRWFHPVRGMISPSDFISVFEQNGFITKLDYFVWECVCKLLRKWLDLGKKPLPISVNVSRVNLYNPKLVDILVELVERYQIEPALFNLELTESAYMDNPFAMREIMTKLQKQGFVIMMDDFGSGYSSLNILKDIFIDVLKIDMRFLSKTCIEGRGENVIASVVRMAQWLKIPVIMEGVETKQQVEFLRGIGCEFVQGYYFAKPMPVENYEQLIESSAHFIENDEHILKQNEFNIDSLWASNPQIGMLFSNFMQPVGMFEFSKDRIELIRVNNAFYELLGFDDDAARDGNSLNCVREDCRQILLNAFKTAVETQDTAECEYSRYLSSGKSIWVHLKLKYVNKIGEKHILFGTIHDVTMQKQIEAELQKYRAVVSESQARTNTMLIVDDTELNRVILSEMFCKDYCIFEAQNGEEAIEILRTKAQSIDVILLDLVMPIMDGKTFLKYRKTMPELNAIPVVIITADESPKEQILTLSLGANDYIVKPFITEVVLKRVANVLESSRRFREIIQECKHVEVNAQNDLITDFYNRATAEKLMTEMLNRVEGEMCFLLLLKLDNFKFIKDTFGEEYGNQVLKKVANQLQSVFRQGDILARMGEDEFCVFMMGVSELNVVFEKGEDFCRDFDVWQNAVDKPPVRCSIGIAQSSRVVKTFDELKEHAENALLDAQKESENSCRLFGATNNLFLLHTWKNKEWLFNMLDDAIFVYDALTYEVLYVSQASLNLYNLKGEYAGRKCYELLHGRSSPCPNCFCTELNYDHFRTGLCVGEFESHKLVVKDKLIEWEGRRAHLQLIIDITDIVHEI